MIPQWIRDKVDVALKQTTDSRYTFFAFICLAFFGTMIYCARLLAGNYSKRGD